MTLGGEMYFEINQMPKKDELNAGIYLGNVDPTKGAEMWGFNSTITITQNKADYLFCFLMHE